MTFSFHAMKRSGHHAVIYWVAKHLPYNVIPNSCGAYFPEEYCNKGFKFTVEFCDYEDYEVRTEIHKRFTSILVMRDPFNLFASREKLAEHKKMDGLSTGVLDLYEGQIKAMSAFSFIIFFNYWLEKENRKIIGKMLGCDKNCEELYTGISKEGWGSSFDLLKYQGDPLKMALTKRWKYLSKGRLERILKRKVIYHFAETYFSELLNDVLEYVG